MVDTDKLSSDERALHVLNRLGFGPRPGDLEHVKRIGAETWIDQQLHPEAILQAPDLNERIGSLTTLDMTPVELFIRYRPRQRALEGAKRDRDPHVHMIVREATEARIVRALYARAQLQEVMTAFWCNHFNIFADKGLCRLWTGAFEQEAIRPHALGRFPDLLDATAKHPAMLFYLDNWQNTAPDSSGARGEFAGINENYARELLELHTVGVDGGYSQADVIALAHILSGWGLMRGNAALGGPQPFDGRPSVGSASSRRFVSGETPRWHRRRAEDTAGAVRGSNGFFLDPRRHDFSAQTFLKRRIAGGGIEQGETALDILARSPATAHHLSYQLAQYFVADNPPPALVTNMAHRYLATDGNIRDVLDTLFSTGEFWDRKYYGAKFKTPYEFVISATRASGLPVLNSRPLAGAMAQLGMPVYGCQTPDGYKCTEVAWLSPDAMIRRVSFATALGAGRLPLQRPIDEIAQAEDHTEQEGATRPAAANPRPATMHRTNPPDAGEVAVTLAGTISRRTLEVAEAAPSRLRAPLILGSPEFMMR
jgi:uncharacterized protein (DUF1800 family)